MIMTKTMDETRAAFGREMLGKLSRGEIADAEEMAREILCEAESGADYRYNRAREGSDAGLDFETDLPCDSVLIVSRQRGGTYMYEIDGAMSNGGKTNCREDILRLIAEIVC